MDYRDIVKSRELRVKLLTFFGWVPDRIMLRLQYWLQTGRRLNLNSPTRYTEKLQLYKMYYRNPDMLLCADKYEVRKYMEDRGFGQYLIPLIGVYNNVDEIDYAELPDKFVAKTTDGGGGNQVLICKDKSLLPEREFREKLGRWMSARKVRKHVGREWAYDNNFPRRIVIEELIGDGELIDYKFFCFGGVVRCIYGLSDRWIGESVQLGVYDVNFNKLDVVRNDERPQEVPLKKPHNFEEMINVVESLAKAFPHVRVDLFNVAGRIYFGELTFYDGSGFMTFTPDSFDEEMGSYFDISSFV